MVKGWAADITPLYDKEIYIKYFERLPRFRKEKAMAQADPLKRVQSVAAWSLWEKLRKKYRLPKETVFNLSHSGEFVMCAVCMGGIWQRENAYRSGVIFSRSAGRGSIWQNGIFAVRNMRQ